MSTVKLFFVLTVILFCKEDKSYFPRNFLFPALFCLLNCKKNLCSIISSQMRQIFLTLFHLFLSQVINAVKLFKNVLIVQSNLLLSVNCYSISHLCIWYKLLSFLFFSCSLQEPQNKNTARREKGRGRGALLPTN